MLRNYIYIWVHSYDTRLDIFYRWAFFLGPFFNVYNILSTFPSTFANFLKCHPPIRCWGHTSSTSTKCFHNILWPRVPKYVVCPMFQIGLSKSFQMANSPSSLRYQPALFIIPAFVYTWYISGNSTYGPFSMSHLSLHLSCNFSLQSSLAAERWLY